MPPTPSPATTPTKTVPIFQQFKKLFVAKLSPNSSLSWAVLALFSFSPDKPMERSDKPMRLPDKLMGHPDKQLQLLDTWNSREIAENQLNLLWNMCMSSLEELQITCMEEDLHEKWLE
jgi:hypothetical protein